MIVHGDCIEAMRSMDECSVDAIVTDPPYGLGFMGRKWDALPPGVEWATECLRVLKPGGHLLAFGGTRTYHRLACAVEDAGFEIRDCIAWLYGSGFPKSHNLKGDRGGWGTALKPAHEPIVMARKSPVGTVAANVLAHGTGALNVDGCRIAAQAGDYDHPGNDNRSGPRQKYNDHAQNGRQVEPNALGRWPANVVLDPDAAAMLDAQTGELHAGGTTRDGRGAIFGSADGQDASAQRATFNDPGGASRFFFVTNACKCGNICGCGNANIAEPSSSPQSHNDASALGDVATPDSREAKLSSAVSGAITTTTASGSGMPPVSGTPLTPPAPSPESRHDGHTPTRGLVSDAEPNEPTGTTTTTASQPTFDGSAAPATSESTSSNTEAGAADSLRFRYCAKASSAERNAGLTERSTHPTVKPVALMRWLVRLVTPPGGLVLDPFTGSGTTGCAVALEGFRFLGIEREAEYVAIAEARIAHWSARPQQLGLAA